MWFYKSWLSGGNPQNGLFKIKKEKEKRPSRSPEMISKYYVFRTMLLLNWHRLFHGFNGLILSNIVVHGDVFCFAAASTKDGDVKDVHSEAEYVDPTLALTEELLCIRVEMKHFHQDRKQLQ